MHEREVLYQRTNIQTICNMKEGKIKIVTAPQLTYQKTIHSLDIEINGVIYNIGREQDDNGAETLFADDDISDEVIEIIECFFSEFDLLDITVGDTVTINIED